ncbi:MAG: hypothetical protein ACI4FX_00340 [Agathobacter sp.]
MKAIRLIFIAATIIIPYVLAIRLIIVFTKEMKTCLTGVNVIKNMNPSDITLVNVAFQEMKHSRVMGSGIVDMLYWAAFTWLCARYHFLVLRWLLPASVIFLIWSVLDLFRRYLLCRYGAIACLKPGCIIAVNEVYTKEKYRFTETPEQDRFGVVVRSINVYKKDSDVAVKFKVVGDGENVTAILNGLTGVQAEGAGRSGGFSFDYCEEEGDYK